MLHLIFKIIFISVIVYLLLNNLLINNKLIEPIRNRRETALNMTNKNAGKIQHMKEEIDTIKKYFNGLKPLEKYANTHSKDIQNLITNKKTREAQEKLK